MALRKVQVWNDHKNDYREVFNGAELVIPSHGYIVMEDSEASQFLGVFTGIRRDGQGRDLNPKMLRKEYFTEAVAEVKPSHLTCMACPAEFKEAKDLEIHSKVHEAIQVKDEPKSKNKFFS